MMMASINPSMGPGMAMFPAERLPIYDQYNLVHEQFQHQQAASQELIPVKHIKALTQSLTLKEALDDKVEKGLATVVDDSLDEVLELACRLAKHRSSKTLQRNDIRLAFEKRLKMRMPFKRAAVGGAGQGGTSAAGTPASSAINHHMPTTNL